MQLGQATLIDRSPRCPRCPGAKNLRMHRHGSYRSKRRGAAAVERFCCPACRLTCTVCCRRAWCPIAAEQRAATGTSFRSTLGSRARGQRDPQGPRALERALRDFASRRQQLCDLFGQLISPAQASLQQLWSQLRKAIGSLETILGMLHGSFRTSLLSDYRCLKAESG
jgi:hypothetical protein